MKKIFTMLVLILGAFVLNAQTLEIYEIQGEGMTTPYEGQTVTTNNNIVTMVLGNSFFMQTPDSRSDNNPNTSDGIMVYLGQTPEVEAGDMVNVTGTATEYYDMTEISNPSVTVVSHNNPLPTAVLWDENTPSPNQPWPENEIERFEGMLVEFYNGVAVSGTNIHGDFWAVAKSQRTFREPGIDYPHRISGLPVFDMNPEKFEIDTFSSDPTLVKGGNVITHVKGCVRYSFGDYGIYPIELEVDTDITPDVASDQPENQYSVGTLNCHVLNDDDNAVLQTRVAKFSKYIREVMKSPDIIALQEVENNNVLQTLANKIHSDDASLNYTGYIIEYDNFSGLNLAFLVKDGITVTDNFLVGETATFNLGGGTYDTFDRPPYMLYAQIDNFAFRVLNVHLRSRNSIDDSQDGEFVRVKRHEQSLWLANYLQNIQNSNPTSKVAIVGDYNAFEFTDGYVDVLGQITGDPDPLGALFEVQNIVNPPLVNLTKNDAQANRYSYVYEGDAQALDHIVVTSAFNNYVRYFKFVHANSDYPEYFENDASSPIATSDHDGAVFRFTTYPIGVEDGGVLPTKFVLNQNYPNPFNPTTTITYSLPVTRGVETQYTVSLQIFNSLGQKIVTLVNKEQAPGNYSVQFNAENLPSGVYFYTLRAGDFVSTRKMILMK